MIVTANGRPILAGDLEGLIEGRLVAFLGNKAAVHDAVEPSTTENVGGSHFTRLVKLSFLAPEVIQAIVYTTP